MWTRRQIIRKFSGVIVYNRAVKHLLLLSYVATTPARHGCGGRVKSGTGAAREIAYVNASASNRYALHSLELNNHDAIDNSSTYILLL